MKSVNLKSFIDIYKLINRSKILHVVFIYVLTMILFKIVITKFFIRYDLDCDQH